MDTERCVVSGGHGVQWPQRFNGAGERFDHDIDLYQEGICGSCGRMVFSRRASLPGSFHPWRLKDYVIREELDLEDLLVS